MISVLVICDDYWHPGEVIELGLEPLEGEEFHFTFVRAAKDILTPKRIAAYPVVMCCKGNSINAANRSQWFEQGISEIMPADFEQYVKDGGGFLAVHACNTSKEGDDMTAFLGNSFVGHPPRCDVDVTITAQHPVAEGVQDFTIRDEHYEINMAAQDADIFMRATSESGGDQVAGYSREIGKGRLCVLTPGHILDVWHHPQFQKLLTNAIRWAARDQG